jgi:membrane protein involved in colicin uptake
MKSVEVADKAAADARKAADDARRAGEKAAEGVMIRFRKVFLKMVEDITGELSEGAD